MTAVSVPFILPGCEVNRVEHHEQGLTIWASTHDAMAICPQCQQASKHVHSTYTRSPRDLPICEYAVRLLLQVRRFRCRNMVCPKKIFVERLPDFLPVHAQRTVRLTNTLREAAFSLGGKAGTRLLQHMQMVTSPATLLRILDREQRTLTGTPRVLGVDDWAMCKGRTYGTILVDLERHCPVDLLPDRSATTLCQWLQEHPGVEIIARDRSTEYIRGATAGAPNAQQVADRWHLLQNMRQVLERLLTNLRPDLQKLSMPISDTSRQLRAGPFQRATPEREASQASRAYWLAQYQTVQRLRNDGFNISQITSRLLLDRKTVRKYFYATQFPERARHRAAKSILDVYLAYLHTRRQEGCANGMQLWREIRQQGYPGTYGQVIRWLRQQNQQRRVPTVSASAEDYAEHTPGADGSPGSPLPSMKRLAWLLMRDPAKLNPADVEVIQVICQHTAIEQVYQLVQQYRTMIQERQAATLDPWLEACDACQLSTITTFANGIRQDYAAVRAALETPWSNGQTEGQVNRLKLLKRQMYGRASFDLLRLRVLHAGRLHQT